MSAPDPTPTPTVIAVVTTLPDRAAAQDLARALVSQGLAACAQISEIESVYRWDGALQQEREFRLLLKTRAALYPRLEVAIRAAHPYELPAIHAQALGPVYGPYARWVEEQTLAAGDDAA
ncbi:divalent-cation tolerance protein CutA [Roseateles sp. DAIF2]|uniref:divalent-cation tolerance protein CutA n=1 Tax=Roseateles sp. DAIF2 TaxID=2714952 RepID=UPI0018A31B95|nr:divalent-cation tolerance protein CutA [Roseateles sp. DAIF2]QPF75938.1 divalent-cation tolerance protein CutA [Roseateles sp. DAIF2]